jgi:hypothetical protein
VAEIEAVLVRTRGRNGRGHARISRALAELAATGTTGRQAVTASR